MFLAFACLALRCPFRRFHFNALFCRFSARFGSARAIYQGNKKKPQKMAISEAFCVRGVSDSVRGDAVKGKGKKTIKKRGLPRLSFYFVSFIVFRSF